ncbi:MAG: peptidase M14 [Candidatus Pacebacteria bacterium]|nr:peptidase M14 [Candidatus Paceibacterota bacterium]
MPIEIDSSFPGGNIVVEGIDRDEVRVHQDLRDTSSDWFYWCFRVRGAEGRTLRFTFTKSRALGVRGPAVSRDEGETWNWLGSDAVNDGAFSYTFPEDKAWVRLSFAMPYQESNWRRFMKGLGNNAAVSTHTLCTTAKGRAVEYELLGGQNPEPRHRVAITCRHHCCEMMANYTLEGLLRWVLTENDAEAQWFREEVAMMVVPFVDKDGVEEGDQGKNRRPRDHARDYEGKSLYASTAAIRGLLPEWGGDRLRVGLDLHCPGIAGEHNEVIYVVGLSDQRNAREQNRFTEILESVCTGPLPFHAVNFLPFGQAWNNTDNYTAGKTFPQWVVAELSGAALSLPIEIPYANAGGAEVNQSSLRLFGKDLGRALASYLRTLPTTGAQQGNALDRRLRAGE